MAEILCDYLSIEFTDLENLAEEDFAEVQKVRLYKDGRIEIE